MMTKFYSINELCKLTLVSVRTLHYYDEINLLKPSRRTSKGHRLYSGVRQKSIPVLNSVGIS